MTFMNRDPYQIFVNSEEPRGRRLVTLVHESLHVATKELQFRLPHHHLHVLSVVLTSELLPHLGRVSRKNSFQVVDIDADHWPYRPVIARVDSNVHDKTASLARMLDGAVLLYKLAVPRDQIGRLATFIVKVTLPLHNAYRVKLGL